MLLLCCHWRGLRSSYASPHPSARTRERPSTSTWIAYTRVLPVLSTYVHTLWCKELIWFDLTLNPYLFFLSSHYRAPHFISSHHCAPHLLSSHHCAPHLLSSLCPSSPLTIVPFLRNMLPELPIAISQPCNRFFHLEDFEFAYLSSKNCPYSRVKNVGEYGSV